MISAAKRNALSAASFLSAMTLLGTASFAIDGGSVAGRNRLSQATVTASLARFAGDVRTGPVRLARR
jgi:hypothetical protein